VQGKRREGSETAVFYVSFISGFVAGSFAAFCVTPLDGTLHFHRQSLMLIFSSTLCTALKISVYEKEEEGRQAKMTKVLEENVSIISSIA